MKYLLELLTALALIGCQSKSHFPKDTSVFGLMGNVKEVGQISTNSEANNYQLDDLFYFDKKGYLKRIEHRTVSQPNIETKSQGRLTLFRFINEKERLVVTLGETDSDTVKVQRITLVDGLTVKIEEEQVWNPEYRSVSIQKFDSEGKIAEVRTTMYQGKSEDILFDLSYSYLYEGGLVKEIIVDESDNQKSTIIIQNKELDKEGNFKLREHLSENGEVMYSEEREVKYY